MILTVTPNPALDLTWHVDRLVAGATHRVAPGAARAGGKQYGQQRRRKKKKKKKKHRHVLLVLKPSMASMALSIRLVHTWLSSPAMASI